MYWIVLANSNFYRIYLYNRKAHDLSLIKEEFNPSSKAKDSQLASDRPGRYHVSAPHVGRGSYSWPTDPKENEIDQFLRDLAKELDAGRINHQYEKIILIAPPPTSGGILKHVDKHIDGLLYNNVQKDYSHFTEKDLREFLQEGWFDLVAEKEGV